MKLPDAQALLERCFAGMAEGAPRLSEPGDARFALRPSAVWLEYRWYVRERGLAEVFLKWDRFREDAEASVLRIHLLGASPTLEACARRVLEGGTPSPERILGLFGDDGVRRECVSFGRTSVTVEHWEPSGPRPLLEAGRFESLAGTLEDPDSTPEERHEAVQRLADERSPRVVDALLALVARKPSLMALRVLSEWGEVRAREALRRDLAAVRPDNPADLWALTALERRLEAWTAVREVEPMKRPKKTWHAVSVIMYFRLKGGRQRSFPVWENVFLVAARTPDEARKRGEELGRAEAEAEGMTWKGKPVEMVFGGVRKVVACAPDPAAPGGADVTKLYDGVEATYSAFLVKGRAELEALIAGKPAALVYEE